MSLFSFDGLAPGVTRMVSLARASLLFEWRRYLAAVQARRTLAQLYFALGGADVHASAAVSSAHG